MKLCINKYLISFLLVSCVAFSQDTPKNKSTLNLHPEAFQKKELLKDKIDYKKIEQEKSNEIIKNFSYKFLQTEIKEDKSFNILSSLNSNINFGGIWDRYAVLNFTPQIFITPVKSVSFKANRYMSCFFPIKDLKENIKDVIIQSISLIAVDNSSKLFFKEPNWVTEIFKFAAKNLLLNLFIKPSAKKTDTPFYENYYYSVTVSF